MLTSSRDVFALATRVAPDSGVRPAAEQTRELARRLRVAQAEAQKCAALKHQRDREGANVPRAETEHEEAIVCLDRLCKEANCTEVNDITEAERRWRRLVQLELELAACEEQLLTAAAGTDLDHFAKEVEQTDADVLDATTKDLEEKITTREDELRGLDQTIGAERSELGPHGRQRPCRRSCRDCSDALGSASGGRCAVCDSQACGDRDAPRYRTISRQEPGTDPGARRRAVRRPDGGLVRPVADRRRRRRPIDPQGGPARRAVGAQSKG